MSETENNRLVHVFTGTLWQAQLIKGLLDSNNIQCTVLDETIGAVTSPYSPTAGDAVVVVNAEDELRALAVIEKDGNACK